MNSIILSYDLRAPGRNYDALYEKIKAFPHWAKITESTWLLKTNKTCVQVRDEIASVVDSNDRVFVTKSTGDAAWKNVICDSNYLKENL